MRQADALNLPAPLPWAESLIAKAGGQPLPTYGTAEWFALPDNDPRRVAGCVVAAECWRTYWEPAEHTWRLAADLDATRDFDDREEWSPEVVARVHAAANRLQNRPEPVDGRPRPGDYPGGNVLPLRRRGSDG